MNEDFEAEIWKSVVENGNCQLREQIAQLQTVEMISLGKLRLSNVPQMMNSEQQALMRRLISRYGCGANASPVEILDEASRTSFALVVFDDIARNVKLEFALPRLTNDRGFIQVFSIGYDYRLEFPTDGDDISTVFLERRPEQIPNLDDKEEFATWLESGSWTYVTSTKLELIENQMHS